jgi:hypothetical protein
MHLGDWELSLKLWRASKQIEYDIKLGLGLKVLELRNFNRGHLNSLLRLLCLEEENCWCSIVYTSVSISIHW